MTTGPFLDEHLTAPGGTVAVIEEVVVVERIRCGGEAWGKLRQRRQVLAEQLHVDQQAAPLERRPADEMRRLGHGHGRPVRQRPELAVALQYFLPGDPVGELVVPAGRGLQLDLVIDEERRGKSRLGVPRVGPVEARESDARHQQQAGAEQPAVLEVQRGQPPLL